MRRIAVVAFLLTACGGSAVQPKQLPPAEPAAAAPAEVDAGSEANASAAPPPREDGRLPGNVHPMGYALDFAIDPSQPTFTGRARINIMIADSARVIVLHGRDLAIRSLSAKTSLGHVAGRATARAARGTQDGSDELVLDFEEELPAGAVEIDVDYEARFAEGLRGLYRVEEGGQAYAFTQFEAIDARRAFPCFDEPGNKTPFQLTITVPHGLSAVANTPEIRREERNGKVTIEFDTSPPLPTYLVALAVGPLEILEGKKSPIPLRLVAAKGKSALGKYALDAAAVHLDLLGKYFDRPYPYAKLDLVAVPNFVYGGMENAGLITFREDRVLLDPAHTSTVSRRDAAETIAHEIAHQWFGDLVTMQWWDDIWLNESFATWMSGKILDEWKSSNSARLELVGTKARMMARDSLAAARPIRRSANSVTEILESDDELTYYKGSVVLSMIEEWIGADHFRAGLRRYMAKHAWGNVTAADLYAALAETSGLDVADVMQSFTEQSGVPVVSAELVCSDDGSSAPWIRLRQDEYRTLDRREGSEKHWRVPVCAVFDAGARNGRQCTVLQGREGRIDLPASRRCPSFMYANAGEAGYYRLRPAHGDLTGAPASARALARLSEAERFGFVGNAWAAVWSGDSSPPSYLALLSSLRKETSRLVWSQIIDSLLEADVALVSDAAQPAFAAWVRDILSPAAHWLGWKEKPGDPDDRKVLRQKVLVALGRLGEDPATVAEAKRVTERWLANQSQVDADLARIALQVAAKSGDRELFDRLVTVLKNPKTPQIRELAMQALTSFDSRDLALQSLALAGDGTLKGQDLFYLLMPLSRGKQTAPVAFEWLEQHIDDVAKSTPPYVLQEVLPGLTSSLCSEERVRAVDAALRPHLEKAESGLKALDEAVETGLRCATLAAREATATQAWLRANAPH